ncbi:MAG: PAS domain S-box protein [Breznakibacter sp.]|nr:PAS domain S-box protein [Breznakibacter sp.]
MKSLKRYFNSAHQTTNKMELSTDYKVALEILANLSKLASEAEIIDNIFHLFVTTFDASKMVYTPSVNGQLGAPHALENPKAHFHESSLKELNIPIYYNTDLLAQIDLSYDKIDLEFTELVATIAADVLYHHRITKSLIKKNSELEEALLLAESNESKYKQLANHAFEGIIIHKNGIALDVNLTLQMMVNYSYDELVGKDLIKLLVLEKYHDVLYQNASNHYPLPYEVEGKRRDGSIISVELESKNIGSFGNEGEVRVTAVRDISKRKEVEKAIEHERIFNLNLIETLPGIFFLYEMQDNHALLLKWNKNHEIFLGYSNADLYQMHVADLFESEQLPKLNYALDLIKQKEEFEMELFIKHKNGTQVPYFLRGKGFENNGKTYLVGIGIDITEQKNIENELIEAKNEAEKSEEKYRNWFEHFPHATFIWKKLDDDFVMVRANKKAYEESNGGIEKVFGIKSRILWQDEPDLTDYLFECYNTKQSRTIERKYYFRGSGEEKFTSTTYNFIPPDSIQIITIDITQQKIADDELKSQKLLFETMFNTISDAVIIADTNRKILLVNDGMHTTFGYEPNEIINHTPEELYENFEAFLDAGNRVFNQNSVNFKDRYITNYKKRSNQIFPGETFGSKLFDAKGKWIGNLAIIRDVSEREALIADLIKARDLAEENNRLKSSFLLNMSHEIKTPMNAINGFSQLIIKPELSPEKRKQFSSIIVSSSMQLQSIVEDILTISALETKQHTISYQPVCINKTVAELSEILKEQAQTKEIALIAEKPLSDTESEIYTDKTKLTQVLTNLIVNALKFTHEGSVVFGYELVDSKLRFYVKDTGIGISLEMQEKIFERFVQVETGMIRQYGGNGLGLSISKGFIELLGGEIWVESTPQQGSTFYFTIPYTAVNNRSDNNVSPQNNLPTILVAEDEKFNFLYIEALLAHSNLNLIHASDGDEALELCRSNKDIRLVLMDIKMPKMDGHTAASRIKEFRPNLPIIAQTAYSFEQYSEKYSKNPFDDYITKPIIEKTLKEKINHFIKILE